MLNVINGFYHPQEGEDHISRREAQTDAPQRDRPAGHRPHLPEHRAVQGHVDARQHHDRADADQMRNMLWQALWAGPRRRGDRATASKVEKIIDFLEIQHIRKTPVGALPYGLQKAGRTRPRAGDAEPELLLLDEPMAGMNVEEKEDMSRFILDVNEEFGTTIALIEHDMGVVMDISDRVVVLDYGRKIGDGPPDEVRANQDVIDAYLGVSH
jgi:branched-chain amino acid transport system ATP-binding protein